MRLTIVLKSISTPAAQGHVALIDPNPRRDRARKQLAMPNRPSYQTVLAAMWEPSRDDGIPLPPNHPPAAATACAAHEKPDPQVLKKCIRKFSPIMPMITCGKGIGSLPLMAQSIISQPP